MAGQPTSHPSIVQSTIHSLPFTVYTLHRCVTPSQVRQPLFVSAVSTLLLDDQLRPIGSSPLHNHHSRLSLDGLHLMGSIQINQADSTCAEAEGGLMCNLQPFPGGHAMRITSPLDFDGIYDDLVASSPGHALSCDCHVSDVSGAVEEAPPRPCASPTQISDLRAGAFSLRLLPCSGQKARRR